MATEPPYINQVEGIAIAQNVVNSARSSITEEINQKLAEYDGAIISHVEPGANLGSPEENTILYARAGNYNTPIGTITLTANLNILFWDKNTAVWSYLAVPVDVDLNSYIEESENYSNNIASNVSDLQFSTIYKTKITPFDKTEVVYTGYSDYVNWWGNNSVFREYGKSEFGRACIKTRNAGNVVFGFATIVAGVGTIVHSKLVAIPAAGVFKYTMTDLEVPDLTAYPKVHLVVRNNSSSGRATDFKGGQVATNHFWFPVAGGSVTQNSVTDISYWAEIKTNDDFALPIKVSGTSNYAQLVDTLTQNNYAFIGEGTHEFASNISPKAGQRIIGKGSKTILTSGPGVSIPIHIKTGEDGVCISDLVIRGNAPAFNISSNEILPAAISAQTNIGRGNNYGIYVQGANGTLLENLLIENFDADGLLIRAVGYVSGGSYPRGVTCSKISIKNCYRGLHLDTSAEYSRYSDIDVTYSLIGATIRGGNNNLSNSHFTSNRLNFHMDGYNSTNDAHGIISGCSANHASLLGAYFKDIKNGQTLNGFTIFFKGAEIDGCKGIRWMGGQIGGGHIVVKNSIGKNHIIGLGFAQTPYRIITSGDPMPPNLKMNSYNDWASDDSVLNN